MFSKIDIMVSRGRSLTGRAGVLTKWPSPIVPKFPSRGNFGDDGQVAFGTESGFPKFSIKKYLGGDSVSGKAVHVWHFFQKSVFSKRFAGFGLFGSDLEPWLQKSSPSCSEVPRGLVTVSGDSAGELENLTRTHDILFWLHLCVSLHCICIGAPRTPCLPSAIPERFAGGLSCQGMTIRLTGCGLCQYGNTNPGFTGAPFLTIRPSAYSDP